MWVLDNNNSKIASLERTRLSSDLTFEMAGALLLAVIFPFFTIGYHQTVLTISLIVTMEALFGFLIYYLTSVAVVEFDDEFMYLMGKDKEEKVSLSNVTFIKLTMGGVNQKDFWKLKYLNEQNGEIDVTFVPKRTSGQFFKFEECVRAKNPKAVIENMASSFDKF